MTTPSNTSLTEMPVTMAMAPFIPWDNPDNVITAETLVTIQNVVICGVTEVVMIVGMQANVLSAMVFARQGLKDRVTLLLFVLALVDFLNLLLYFSINMSCFIRPLDPVLAWNVETLQYPHVLYLNLAVSGVSIALVTILSLDRCVAITWPLKAAGLLTYRRTTYIMAGTIVTIVVFFLPSLWLDAVSWVPDPVSGRPMAQLVPTEFAIRHQAYNEILKLFNPLLKLVCLAGVTISCSITVKTLKAASKLRANMTESKINQAEAKITVMLLFVCGVMVACLLPEISVTVGNWIVSDFLIFKRFHNIFVASQYFIFLARSVNSASNFFMYLALSTKFRVTFLTMLPCVRWKAVDHDKLTEATQTSTMSAN